jgi:hypothetical protein
MTRLAVLALLALSLPPASQPAPQEIDFVPVGVRYAADPGPGRRTIDYDTIGRARFNVVAAPADGTRQTTTLTRVDRPSLAAPPATVAVQTADLGVIRITAATTAENVKEAAWTLIARGSRGVIFDNWLELQQNAAALAEASAFAQAITSNMALYAPLRHVDKTGARAIALKGDEGSVEVHWLESAEALVLVAVNRGGEPREVVFTFPAEVPEAVWQNMLSGGSVNFVAGPTGPFYEHAMPVHDVLVLMIRKRWK